MELSPLLIYFIGQLNSIDKACGLIVFFGGVVLLLTNVFKTLGYINVSNNDYSDCVIREYRRFRYVTNRLNRVLGPIVFVAFLGSLFLPSRSTVAAMIVLPAITNNTQVQNISQGALRWAEEYIKNQLEVEVKKATKGK
jgi:hypothetical protein